MRLSQKVEIGKLHQQIHALQARIREMEEKDAAARKIISAFVDTIDVTGGVVDTGEGFYAPFADMDWVDMGMIYLDACVFAQHVPLVDVGQED